MTKAPYEPVTELTQVPIALLEARQLAEQADLSSRERLVQLLTSIITVTLAEPQAWHIIGQITPES